jgi:hypothetical protein
MRIRPIFASLLLVIASFSSVSAQSGTVVVTLDESFFEALLDAVFKDGGTVDFAGFEQRPNGGDRAPAPRGPAPEGVCDETVRLHRSVNGKRTSVKLRDGKILLPVAFTGAYAPPLFGCVDYSGLADAEMTVSFDAARQSLVGRVRVVNVDLSTTRGVGGGIIARFVQRSIDEKINPIEILGLNSISFAVPVPGSNVTMKATRITQDIGGGSIVIRITYEFARS